MKKNGFTLVEMIATLIILSIIAVIVTPNIYVSIKDYKNRLYDTQLDSIKQAAKNWVVDNVNKTSDEYSLLITVQDLQRDGYIHEKLENPKDGGYFDESSVFVLVTCQYVQDETGNLSSNYKYTYGVYSDQTDYREKMAIQYAKDHNLINNTSVTVSDLKKGYIPSQIQDINGNSVAINSATITITVTKSDDSKTGDTVYSYSASIN